jgi:hypothetical protein
MDVSIVSDICCQVEVSATGRSLFQRSLMDVSIVSVMCGQPEVSAKG